MDYSSVLEIPKLERKGTPNLSQNHIASAEEQFVISALCNIKSNRIRRVANAATNTISCDPHADQNDVKMEPSPSLDSVASSTDTLNCGRV
jgi:hypothetical protein